MKLNNKRVLLLGVVFLSISILNGAHDSITNKILEEQFNVPAIWSGLIMAIDNILALFMLPVFGRLSDACTSPWGKRKPFVFFGTLSACLFLLLFPIAINTNNLTMFIIVICLFLVALGTYRSAGVALVSDVTIKPLRSKANALINLMGAVAFILGQLFTLFLFKDATRDANGNIIIEAGRVLRAIPIQYYYIGIVVIALLCLVVYLLKINERKLTKEREDLENELKLEDDVVVDGVKIKIDKAHAISLILILLTIAFWTFGYNGVTTFYGVYASEILGIKDGGFAGPTLIAGIAGFASYIPIGIISSKIGRRKTILGGLVIAFIAFGFAIFARVGWLMYVLFALVGVAQASIIVNTLPMVVEFANRNTVGQFTGYYYIATQTASALSPLLIGAIRMITGVGTGIGIGGPGGLLSLFPYATIFMVLAFIPLLFAKYGDSKPIPKESKLEMLDND